MDEYNRHKKGNNKSTQHMIPVIQRTKRSQNNSL